MENLIYIALIPFIFVLLFVPIIKKMAIHVGALDIPDARKVHKQPMPRLGGVAIFFGFLLGYMIYGVQGPQMNAILIGSYIVLLTGIVDDIKPLSAKIKFVCQIIAALILVYYGGFLLSEISAFGITIKFGILSPLLTVFFILGCINCINLIDGLDGLAAGISSIYFFTVAIISVMQGIAGIELMLSLVLLGSTLGFLVHNFNPATIFMGDSGSMFLGYMIAAIALLGFKNVTLTSLLIPILMLAIPILDTLFAIIRRALKGEPISKPDKFHIHHQLLNRNFTQKQTVLIIYFINILFALASIIYVTNDRNLGYIIYGILFVIIIWFITKTEVIFKKKGNNK
jgi:UDP-GlcNAc:undecaprenyl-phosphate GlcNAc-1-phosphate transferase